MQVVRGQAAELPTQMRVFSTPELQGPECMRSHMLLPAVAVIPTLYL